MIEPSLLGRVIDGKYRIDAEIGAGGMATIYRATRLQIGDAVAIKVLHAELLREPQFTERFKREAQAAARLKHPNVVAIYDFGVSTEGVIYLVMELVEGPNLRTIIRDTGPMPAALAAEIVRQVCAALAEAHRQQLVHRDIKPANIAVESTPDGPRVKVLDFGIASLRTGGTFASLTQTGAVMGTPAYMSPEQCLGEDLDGRSDIYSLGVVLFEMLCGVVPFNSPTATAVVMQHVQQAPPPLRVLNVSISPAMEAVVLRALAKPREERFQTAREFADALTAVVTGPRLTFGAETMAAPAFSLLKLDATTMQPALQAPAAPARARSIVPIGVVIGVLLAVVIGGAWFGVQRWTAKPGPVSVRTAQPRPAATARQPLAAQVPISGVRENPVNLVKQYYRLWNERQYATMYAMLSSPMQRKNPYDQYVKYHSAVMRIDVDAAPGSAPDVVDVSIVSRDRERNGAITENYNAGQWFVAVEDGQLKLNDQKAHETRPSVIVAAAPAPVYATAAPVYQQPPPVATPVPADTQAQPDASASASVALVQQYYRLWNMRAYDTMYGMLSTNMQRKHPYGDYVKYHAMVVRIAADVTPSDSPYTANVRIVSQDREKDGSITQSVNEGQWYLTSEDGQLKLDSQKLQEVSSTRGRPPAVAAYAGANSAARPGRLNNSLPAGFIQYSSTLGIYDKSDGCTAGMQRILFYNDYTTAVHFDSVIQDVDSDAEVTSASGTRLERVHVLSGQMIAVNGEVPICKSRLKISLFNLRVSPNDTGPIIP
ncbi:MAG: Serine/threonine protein kinase [Candidatus Eremiobacteraeota bacterium]|nr:Serine/threonine protein kinase [Candidatus Eremiobacteraeota bacterium]